MRKAALVKIKYKVTNNFNSKADYRKNKIYFETNKHIHMKFVKIS